MITGDVAVIRSGGCMITGELAANPLCTGSKCVEGAATALIADRARAEPRATHEIFNPDEDIWRTPQKDNGICRED
jgi:hypothetical protein